MTGSALRGLRTAIGLSIDAVASVMGITVRALDSAERGDTVSPEFASLFSSAVRHLGAGRRTAVTDFHSAEVR